MNSRPQTREVILAAAEAVVLEVGAAHLTLEAVADGAGLSKGGLMYHFPTKEALLTAMVARLLWRWEEQLQEAADRLPPGPKRPLQAYVRASMAVDGTLRRLSAALLAAVANDPRLLEPVRQFYQDWFKTLTGPGLWFERAAIVSLAVDGLWLLELLQVTPLTDDQRERVAEELLQMIDREV